MGDLVRSSAHFDEPSHQEHHIQIRMDRSRGCEEQTVAVLRCLSQQTTAPSHPKAPKAQSVTSCTKALLRGEAKQEVATLLLALQRPKPFGTFWVAEAFSKTSTPQEVVVGVPRGETRRRITSWCGLFSRRIPEGFCEGRRSSLDGFDVKTIKHLKTVL